MNEDDKRILKSLRSHNKNSNLDEVDQFCKYLDNQHVINEQDEEFMHHVCRILRTNSFEVPILKDGEKGKNISYIRGKNSVLIVLNFSCKIQKIINNHNFIIFRYLSISCYVEPLMLS